MLARQIRDELLIRIRLRPPQFMIEVYDAEDNSQLVPQLQQQPQQRHRINSSRHGHAHSLPSHEEALTLNVREQTFAERIHGDMVAQFRQKPGRGWLFSASPMKIKLKRLEGPLMPRNRKGFFDCG